MFRPLTTRVWRAVFEGEAHKLLNPASGRYGRWHYDHQPALYCSDTPDGCRVRIKSFAKETDASRVLLPINVTADRIVDLGCPTTRVALQTSLDDIHAFWKDSLTEGQISPTWALSDRLRALGAQGILSPSRSRPELTHVTLFTWNSEGGASVQASQEQPIPF